MKVSELFSGFLEAEDLPADKDITLTIESIRVAGPKDKGRDGRIIDKPIVKLGKVQKEWVLNKTNARAIRRFFGNETDHWIGQKITVYRTTCDAFGDPKTPCIRVRTATL
jgi:hypothetical protein